MTINEFRNEFIEFYNAASNGAPNLNDYEISLFLTQGIRELVDELYSRFEYDEYSKRALNPLIATKELCLSTETDSDSEYSTSKSIDTENISNFEVVDDYYKNLIAHKATLPANCWHILQEQVKILDPTCNTIDTQIIPLGLDEVNKMVNNPFKKPNDRKIFRILGEDGFRFVKLLATKTIECYKVKYLKKYTPIILSNFEEDDELVGDETIDGFNTVRSTELPVFLHDKIVKRGVILAIKSLRQNNLQTQIQV